MKSFLLFVCCVGLACASFLYARNHYVEINTVPAPTSPKKSHIQKLTDPLVDRSLFGPWVKKEWVFAIAVPAVLILGGLYVSTRR